MDVPCYPENFSRQAYRLKGDRFYGEVQKESRQPPWFFEGRCHRHRRSGYQAQFG
jgi:hypothetical protein